MQFLTYKSAKNALSFLYALRRVLNFFCQGFGTTIPIPGNSAYNLGSFRQERPSPKSSVIQRLSLCDVQDDSLMKILDVLGFEKPGPFLIENGNISKERFKIGTWQTWHRLAR